MIDLSDDTLPCVVLEDRRDWLHCISIQDQQSVWIHRACIAKDREPIADDLHAPFATHREAPGRARPVDHWANGVCADSIPEGMATISEDWEIVSVGREI